MSYLMVRDPVLLQYTPPKYKDDHRCYSGGALISKDLEEAQELLDEMLSNHNQ